MAKRKKRGSAGSSRRAMKSARRKQKRARRDGDTPPGPRADPPALPKVPDLRTIERTLAAFGGGGGGSRDRNLEAAQGLIYDAWEIDDREQRIELATRAIELSPLCADAYSLLADEEADSVEERRRFLGLAMQAGEAALGPAAFEEDVGHFWGILETRPYMRARLSYAQCLWEDGRVAEAIDHARELLRLNPGDNQGVRYLLAAWLLEDGRPDELAAHLDEYPDESSPFLSYPAAALAFLWHGDSEASRAALLRALASNGHVPDYMLGRKRLPRAMPTYHSPGDVNEAVGCAPALLAAWKRVPGALEWLKRHERELSA